MKKDKIRNEHDCERVSRLNVAPVAKKITEKKMKGHVKRREHMLRRIGKRWRGRQKTRWKAMKHATLTVRGQQLFNTLPREILEKW